MILERPYLADYSVYLGVSAAGDEMIFEVK